LCILSSNNQKIIINYISTVLVNQLFTHRRQKTKKEEIRPIFHRKFVQKIWCSFPQQTSKLQCIMIKIRNIELYNIFRKNQLHF
jgi:hypothetical protein